MIINRKETVVNTMFLILITFNIFITYGSTDTAHINELFETLTSTDPLDNIPKPPGVIIKNITIDLEKVNFTTILSKIDKFSFNLVNKELNESDLKDIETRRLSWIGSGSQWAKASKVLVETKLFDLMLQLIYMARHKIKQIESEAYYNPADSSYRIAFLYRRLRRIWKRMLDIYTTMVRNRARKKYKTDIFASAKPFLILHHKAVKLHVDFIYLWWVLVKLHERYDFRHGFPVSLPPNYKSYMELAEEKYGNTNNVKN